MCRLRCEQTLKQASNTWLIILDAWMQNVLYSISIAGDTPVQEVKDGTKCDTCRSTECISHWRAGIVALILFSFLMSNIKFEALMQHWGNAVQRCRMIISDAAWCCPERTSLSVPQTAQRRSEAARISKNSRGAGEQGGVWLHRHLYGERGCRYILGSGLNLAALAV